MAKGKKTTAIPYQLFPDNPRVITDDEFLRLGESMGEFGSLDGIVVNLSPGRYEGAFISGNQKVKHIGLENVIPVITETFDEPTAAGTVRLGHILYKGEKFPYREVYWSETKCEIGNIRANNYGGHNDPSLLSLFPDEVLLQSGIDIKHEEAMFKLLQTFMPVQQTELPPEPPIDKSRVEQEYQNYLNQNIRQVVLFYAGELYERVVERLSELCQEHGIEDNSSLILKLIGIEYENENEG